MASRFDPSRFIAAERAAEAVAPAVAPVCNETRDTESRAKSVAYEHNQGSVAVVATVAAPLELDLPWRDGLEALLRAPIPALRTPAWWQTLIDDAVGFARTWGNRARDLGWTELELYGSPVNPYVTAVDQLGLVPLLAGRKVIELSETAATIANVRGGPNRFYRSPHLRPGVPIWVAYSCEGGP